MRQDPEKQEEILKSALKKFFKAGVRKTSLAEIAKDVGISSNMFAVYFKDKESLVLGCADRFLGHHVRESKRICDSNLEPLAKMKIYVLNRFYAWRELHDSTPQAVEFGTILMRLGPDRINDDEELFAITLGKIIHQGVSARRFKIENPEQEGRMVANSLAGFFPLSGLRRPRPIGEKDLIEMLEWFAARWKRK